MTDPAPASGQPRRWRLVGAVAAVALAASSWGSGSRPELHTRILWPGVTWWADTGGSPLLASVSVLAMGVLVLAWWRLRGARVSVRWWWTTAGAWFVPLVASVPLYSRDLYSYAAQGALWGAGLSPYEHGVRGLESDWRESTAPTWLDTPTPYGPVWLALARACAALAGEQLWVALLLLRLLAVAGVVVMAWAVADVAGRVGVAPERATWLGVATPLVGAHLVSGAHNDALMIAAVVAGFALALRGRFAWACVVVALGAMVKVTALVAVPFVALMWAAGASRSQARRGEAAVLTWAGVLRACGMSAVATLVPIAVVGVSSGLGWSWLNPGGTPGRNEQWTSLPTGFGMAVGAIGHVLGRPEWRDAAIATLRLAAVVLLVVVLVVIWLRTAARAGDGGRVVRAAGWAYVAVILLSPVFLGWYFLWALPLLAASLPSGRARTWLAVVATVLCFAQLPDGYSLGLTTTAVGVPLVVVATALLARAGWRWVNVTDWRHFLDLSRTTVAEPGRADRH